MLITIAICTLNRAESLRRTLESLTAMNVPGSISWEVLVVNNSCTDSTDAIIRSFTGRLPIRRAFEGQRGLSRARNRAIDMGRGDYFVWTDDDVVVDPRWLGAYAAAFGHWPQAAVFGGPIVPRYVAPVPRWLAESEPVLRNSVYGGRDFGTEVLELSIENGRLPWGPNFAVRGIEQRRFRYNLQLGHAPGQQRRGEELDGLERILRAGASGYWIPTARVEHCTDPSQQTLRYVASYFASIGETQSAQTEPGNCKFWFSSPRWVWRLLIEGWMCYSIHRLISPPPVWVQYLRKYAYARGALRFYSSKRQFTPQA